MPVDNYFQSDKKPAASKWTIPMMKIWLILIFLCAMVSAFAQKHEPMHENIVWQKKEIRIVDISEPADTTKHYLKERNSDTAFAELIAIALKSGKVSAYSTSDTNLSTPLTTSEIEEFFKPTIDTITDCEDCPTLPFYLHRDFIFDEVQKYKILENCVFQPVNGKTKIDILAIAPMMGVGDDRLQFKTLFWLKFQDVKGIMDHYNQYHPTHTIAIEIWDSYFQSDTKPAEYK
jgi:hypothetical protein